MNKMIENNLLDISDWGWWTAVEGQDPVGGCRVTQQSWQFGYIIPTNYSPATLLQVHHPATTEMQDPKLPTIVILVMMVFSLEGTIKTYKHV